MVKLVGRGAGFAAEGTVFSAAFDLAGSVDKDKGRLTELALLSEILEASNFIAETSLLLA